MKGIVLNSGGIDSPVAAHILLEKGYEVSCVFFDNMPYTDEKTKKRALLTIERISKIHNKRIKTFAIPNGHNLSSFFRICGRAGRNLTCIFCRRTMFRIAKRITDSGADFLVTGENLGQVASQTLTNILVTSRAVNIPIVRPLIGLDKLEIIKKAKRIRTYDISIRKAVCCFATPKYPAIRASLERIKELERKINIKENIEKSIETMEIIK